MPKRVSIQTGSVPKTSSKIPLQLFAESERGR